MIIEVNGHQVEVDDSFADLSPEQQQVELQHITSALPKVEPVAETSGKEDMPFGVKYAPETGALLGSISGAAAGPTFAKGVVEPVVQSGAKKLPGQGVKNYIAATTELPYAGGKTYETAYQKANIAAGQPVKSRGSNVPIRRGSLGLTTQPEPPSFLKNATTSATTTPAAPAGRAGSALRMGAAGSLAGKTVQDINQGNYGDAALHGTGALAALAGQSRYKPLRILGNIVAGGEIASGVAPYFTTKKPVEEKAAGGLAGYAKGQKVVEGGLEAAKKLFDPRFDKRVLEQPRLHNLKVHTEQTGVKDIPRIHLPDYEGQGFVTSMSDRTDSGSRLLGINDVMFNRPVDLNTGKKFMYNNPNMAWASGKLPVNQIMKEAAELKKITGKDPLYVPWRMAPTGSDFAHVTGETMLAHADSAMGAAQKKDLNNAIKKFIPDWKGVEDPASLTQFHAAPANVRKSIQNTIDRDLRGSGGLSIGETRLAIADPNQIASPEGGVSHVARIYADKPVIEKSGSVTYPFGVPGEGVGQLDKEHIITEMLPNLAAERNIIDVANPSAQDLRALQMKPYSGIFTDKLLKSLGYNKGGPVGYAAGKKVVEAGLKAIEPQQTVKAYKLFRTDPKTPESLYPLFVNANKPVPIGQWLPAEAGELTQAGKVKSKIGDLAYRPGWHAGDMPIATHIGGKSSPELTAPDFRPSNQVWAEVEMPADVDWQKVALERAQRNKAGDIIPRTAHITDTIPEGGHYRYKTNPNMTGDWLIGGSMKVNRVLTPEEVMAINEAKGVADLPRYEPLPKKAEGGLMCLKEGGKTPAWQRKEGKNPEGGLNAAGRASYNRETGGNLKAPQPEGGPRRDSFCARMSGMKKKLTSSKTANDPDSRINKALRKWNC